MSVKRTVLAVIIGLTLYTIAIVLLNATGAMAAGSGERVGQNIGNLLGGWAKSLFVGIVALVSLKFLLARRFSDLAVFAVAALMVGGFVMVPNDVAQIIHGIWSTVAG